MGIVYVDVDVDVDVDVNVNVMLRYLNVIASYLRMLLPCNIYR